MDLGHRSEWNGVTQHQSWDEGKGHLPPTPELGNPLIEKWGWWVGATYPAL